MLCVSSICGSYSGFLDAQHLKNGALILSRLIDMNDFVTHLFFSSFRSEPTFIDYFLCYNMCLYSRSQIFPDAFIRATSKLMEKECGARSSCPTKKLLFSLT